MSLPNTYTRLTHLYCNGNQLLTPNISTGDGYTIEMKIVPTQLGGSYYFTLWGKNGQLQVGYETNGGITNGASTSSSYKVYVNNEYTIKCSSKYGTNPYIYLNDVNTGISRNVASNYSIRLLRASDREYGGFIGNLKEIKLYDQSNNLYRYYIPAKRNSDNVLGMLDVESNTFLTNTGSGTFTAGNEIKTSVNPANSGTVDVSETGGIYTITAQKNSGYKFLNWLLKGYTQLEYIESSGTQYVDTGVYPTDSIVIKMKFKNIAVTGNTIIGNNGSGESDTFRFFNFNSTCYLDYGSGLNKNRIYGGTCSANTVYEFELGNRYVKNIQTGTNIISGSSVSFAQKSFTIMVNGASNFSSNAFYYIKIYDNDTLVRDFIPVIRHSDGAIGLLDLVNLKFYGNSGSGSFIAGGAI